LAEYA